MKSKAVAVSRVATILFESFVCTCALLAASYIVQMAGMRAGSGDLFYRFGTTYFIYICSFFLLPGNGTNHFSKVKGVFSSIDAVSVAFISITLLNILLNLFGKASFVTIPTLILSSVVSIFLLAGFKTAHRESATSVSSMPDMSIYIIGKADVLKSLKIRDAIGEQWKVEKVFTDNIDTLDIGIPKYIFSQLEEEIANRKVDLILLLGDLDHPVRARAVEVCLANKIRVKELPEIVDEIDVKDAVGQAKNIPIERIIGRGEYHEHSRQVLELIAAKRILITGAAGSIGGELARQIAAVPHAELILCDQHENGLYELEYALKKSFSQRESIKIRVADIRDEKSMEHLFRLHKPQVVFHAAAYKHVPMMEANPSEAVRNNVTGTSIVADLSVKYGVERFLFVSTDKAINPTNVMGATKRVAEIYVHTMGDAPEQLARLFETGMEDNGQENCPTKFISTRFGNVVGSNGSVIPRFHEQIAGGGPVTVTHPDVIRYFMTISEACALVLEAVTMGKGGEVFRFDMGEPIKIRELADKMIRLAGFVPGEDIRIEYCGLRPGEKLFEEMLNKEEERVTSHHKKILVSNMAGFDYEWVSESIHSLMEAASKNQDEEVVRQMKRMIPEYISNNSIYQSFDERKEVAEATIPVR